MPTNGMRKTASNQAVADDGRRFSGMKPSATTLTMKSATTSTTVTTKGRFADGRATRTGMRCPTSDRQPQDGRAPQVEERLTRGTRDPDDDLVTAGTARRQPRAGAVDLQRGQDLGSATRRTRDAGGRDFGD